MPTDARSAYDSANRAGLPEAAPVPTPSSRAMFWKFRGRGIDLTDRAAIAGIVNVTPDSFSDGGRFGDPSEARDHGLRLLEEGADLLDIGGESTRPGSRPVSVDEEMRRVLPVIRSLRETTAAPLSVDTSKAEVAEAALEAGADIINDVTGLTGDPRMTEVAVRHGAGLILMHMQGCPETMQASPSYPGDDVAGTVAKFLSERRAAAIGSGVDASSILLDPGLGFGKTAAHNLALLAAIPALSRLGAPLLIGHSRKSFLGPVSERQDPALARLPAGLAVIALARTLGARVFRVHDVAPHLAALRMSERIAAA